VQGNGRPVVLGAFAESIRQPPHASGAFSSKVLGL
jgi:hypothetical protein